MCIRDRLRGTGIKHEFVSGSPNIREDMEVVADLVAKGKIRGVYTVVELGDIEEVRKACEKVAAGKGGLGKLVLKILGAEDD